MPDGLTNLLPSERRIRVAREYQYRLGVVIASLVALLTLAAAVLLLPTYVFLTGSAAAKSIRLASIRTSLSSADQAALAARLAALSSDAAALTALSSAPSASGVVRAVLAVSRPGITLSGFTYAPASGGKAGTLALTGTAATRDALRSYQLTLQSAPFARAADLPVSAYAKDTDITFTVILTLAP
ncbi:MAG TPA: hypothetical protein VMV62_02425 [Candidatus Paceibacterota bacterium]|nr:hypothetical protein [Candidatus Paceibacterota bacterium]